MSNNIADRLIGGNAPSPQELSDLLMNGDNKEFREVVERLPKNYWAKYDLSAMRIGFEIANTLNQAKLQQVERERDVTQARLDEAVKIIKDIPKIYYRIGVDDIDMDGLCEWAGEFLANQSTDKE